MNCGVTVILKYRNMIVNLRVTAAENSFLSRCTFYYLTIGKGPNGTLSMIFDGIKKLNKGEKHLKITCDNAGGQNKNNVTIWFYLYLVICGYESIELNFMVPGHTKFKCDGSFGMIKKLYRRTRVALSGSCG